MMNFRHNDCRQASPAARLPEPDLQQQEAEYGGGYFGEIYRDSLILFAVAAAIFLRTSGVAGLAGVAYGALISLLVFRVLEIGVRRWLRPHDPLNGVRLAALLILKLPVLALVLSGAVWLVAHQAVDGFAVVGGVGLTSAVIFVKAVRLLLVSLLPPAPAPLPERGASSKPVLLASPHREVA